MNLPHYVPRIGFWVDTTFVIIVTVFPIIFVLAFSGGVWLVFGLALIPATCVGLLQAFILASSSIRAWIQWFSLSVISIAVGWYMVFLLRDWLRRLHLSSTIGDPLRASLDGFLLGVVIGALIGLVTGTIQGYIQRLSARTWIIGNVISWSIGIGIPFALLFAYGSQLRFT